MHRACWPWYRKCSAIAQPAYGAMNLIGAASSADAATMMQRSSVPAWRSPMISSRWPRPIGIIASTALRPVCIGSTTGWRWTTPGALNSAGRNSDVLMSPLSSSGRPSGSTRRPSSCSPTGISRSLPVRFTVSSSETLSHSPKSTAPTLSSSRLSASPTTSCGSSSVSSDWQLSSPWIRAIPSPISMTVPTSERSADSTSSPSIRSLRIDAISSGLISMLRLVPFLRRSGDALSQFLEPVSNTRVQDHVADLQHQPAEDVRVDTTLQLNGVAGLLLDLPSDPLGDLGIELDRARHGDAEPLVLLVPERFVLAADPEDHRHPALLEQELQEVEHLRLGVRHRPLQALDLLRRGEVGAEEEQPHLPVLFQDADELPELVADRVELPFFLRRREQGGGVYAGDLLHLNGSLLSFASGAPSHEAAPSVTSPEPSPLRLEKSTSARASSISRFWSSGSSDFRVTFSVVKTVRSATSLRMRSSERLVSASMSRRAAASSSSRFSRPCSAAPAVVVSAVLRARAMMSSACSRASLRRARYSSRILLASSRVFSASSIDSRIRLARLSSASWIRGKATLLSTYIVIPKTSSVQIISPTLGETRKLPPDSSPPPPPVSWARKTNWLMSVRKPTRSA